MGFYQDSFVQKYLASFQGTFNDTIYNTPGADASNMDDFEYIGTKCISTNSNAALKVSASTYNGYTKYTDACVYFKPMTPRYLNTNITGANTRYTSGVGALFSPKSNFFGGTGFSLMTYQEATTGGELTGDDQRVVILANLGSSVGRTMLYPFNTFTRTTGSTNNRTGLNRYLPSFSYTDATSKGWFRVYYNSTTDEYFLLPLFQWETKNSVFQDYTNYDPLTQTGNVNITFAYNVYGPKITYHLSGTNNRNVLFFDIIGKLYAQEQHTTYDPLYMPTKVLYGLGNGSNTIGLDGTTHPGYLCYQLKYTTLINYLYDFGIPKLATTLEDAQSTPYEDLIDIVPQEEGYLASLNVTSDNGTVTMAPAFDAGTKNYAVYTTNRSIKLSASAINLSGTYIGYSLNLIKGAALGGTHIKTWDNESISNYYYTLQNSTELLTLQVIGYLAGGTYELLDTYSLTCTFNPDFVPEDLQTMAPGQEINPVINTGGTGDFHSGTIEEIQTGATGTSGYNGTSYILNPSAFKAVKSELWNADYIDMIKNLFSTGQEAIINCLLFPFNVHSLTGVTSSSVSKIYLGTHELTLSSPAASYVVTGTGATYVEVGPVSFSKVLGGYLDDAPVTECFINLPFIGMKPIDPEILYGHQVKVRYLIDLTTGECTAQVKSNVLDDTTKYISMYEFNGQIGIPLAFTESNINQNRLAIGIETIKGALAGAASGGEYGALAGGASALASGVMNNVNSVHVDGATGSGLERLKSMDIFVLFIYPKTAIPNDYNKIKGRPSSITVAPSSLKGYTVIEEPILNITGTEEEKEELNSLLKSGIRIK